MAMSREQEAIADRTHNQDPTRPLQSNWCSQPVKPVKEKEWEYHVCTAKNTIAVFKPDIKPGDTPGQIEDKRSIAVHAAIDFVYENPNLILVPYQPGTDEERIHRQEMRREQGYNYYED